MKIAIASDHGGYELKNELKPIIQALGHEVSDLGAHGYEAADDYPDFARYLSQAIQHRHAERGVLICGSGVGACVAANKHKGVRAAICHDAYSARQGVEHDDMNVLCLGARIIGIELAKVLVHEFLDARFTGEDRHSRRLAKVLAIEASG